MCGIAGLLQHEGALDEAPLRAMRDSMLHRGPDGSGIWVSRRRDAALANTRLAVVEPSALASQPMSNEDGTVWIVHNGEIYNAPELRNELVQRGHHFRTAYSDTEVIVHAFEEWGAACVDHFLGMFAIAIWDERSEHLWLIRDRLGIKPLYYCSAGSSFVFASEIRALFASGLVLKEIDDEAVYHYLTLLAVPAPGTMFRGINKLEAGTVLEVRRRGAALATRYWDAAAFLNDYVEQDEEAACVHTRKLLSEAIGSMATADAPLSTTLSSGVDSTLVTALLREKGVGLRAYVADYEVGSEHSESDRAESIATALGVTLQKVILSRKTFFDGLEACIAGQQDVPIGAPDVVALYLLAEQARSDGAKVCFVGEGADELGGYPSYLRMAHELPALRWFSTLPTALKEAVMMFSPSRVTAKLDIACGRHVVSRKHVQSFGEVDKRRLWCGKRVGSSYGILERLMLEVDQGLPDTFYRQVFNIEFKLRLPEFMLARVDAASMAQSVEARVPLLDHRLVEYMLRLDSRVKMGAGDVKRLFKMQLQRHLDPSLVNRRKIGFGRMMSSMLANDLPFTFEKEIMNQRSHPLFCFLRPDRLRALLRDHQAKKAHGFKLWTLYSLGRWLETHRV